MRAELNDIFESNFEARIETVFSNLSGGRTVELARENPDRTYVLATIRILHPHKNGLAAHTGNALTESYDAHEHLQSIVKLTNSLSYFIIIDKPERGGKLVLYDLLWEQTTADQKKLFATARVDKFLSNYRQRSFAPEIGDMILFNGGRIWPGVSNIQGNKIRITIGGFMGISKDDLQVFYWS